ncbi:hypothetical protein KAFR_0B05140 [Kazachstania africana CBS 2517]|uniref:CRA domain-containing protein n=1 Tax=Kazachstania africana (strain ATCC 22294 / BCRC 22015 / CBS 2517 / CECT 1963 / NBRC 1671 / NRRL Y-8276) TaxID=1071382 RepID=H2AR10_KAZAF|nr:hypothetical protein KAFR_0B05140 [Kazachstania africana CBS 2517]CCF56810.1 hypothetical protein KAFR_0B05140 [Kazachstania africana CBS 2517]
MTTTSKDKVDTNSATKYTRKSFSKNEWKEKVLADKFVINELIYNNNNTCTTTAIPTTISSTSKRSNILSTVSNKEPSLSKLLLNYFITMAHEESSIRMAKELNYIKNNKDLLEFNSLFKIKERSVIIHLIKSGNINGAMDNINKSFGLSVLESINDENSTVTNNNSNNDNNDNNEAILTFNEFDETNQEYEEDDLHFKLLLLNLVEMIRTYRNEKKSNENDDEFILNLINYSKEKLALKASTNKHHMEELELTITLLLFPINDNSNIKLPKNLKNLYSLSLRSKIANSVNKKLLEHIHPYITNQSKFPDFVGGLTDSDYNKASITNITKNISKYKPIIRTNTNKTKEIIAASMEIKRQELSGNKEINDIQNNSMDSQFGSISNSNNYWAQTKQTLFNNFNDINSHYDNSLKDKTLISSDSSSSSSSSSSDTASNSKKKFVRNNNFFNNISNYQYEARLIQLMKLWAWCENELHAHDIGVPRVEDDNV